MMQAVYISVILVILCFVGTNGGPGSSKPKEKPILPKGTECGISRSAPNAGRIVGGAEAVPHSWPWQVCIICKNPVLTSNLYSSFFGGSIISDTWIVTAAHTLYKNATAVDAVRDCIVALGKHDIQKLESGQISAKIAKYVVHGNYDPSVPDVGFDLGLIKLATAVKFTDTIKPICLPFGLPELPVRSTCYATGWGQTVHNISKISDQLKQLSMPVKDGVYCNIRGNLIRRTICTGEWLRNEDTCYGDSGGPLTCQESDRKWYLRGVLSRSTPECDSITVSTKVSFYERWITDTIAQN